MSEENLDAWHKAFTERTEHALALAAAYVAGDMAKVEKYASLYEAAVEEMDRQDRGESK